jgi:hypothetical protein
VNFKWSKLNRMVEREEQGTTSTNNSFLIFHHAVKFSKKTIPKNSQNIPDTLKNSQNFSKFANYESYQILNVSQKFSTFLKDSQRFSKILNVSQRFSTFLKDSQRFSKAILKY